MKPTVSLQKLKNYEPGMVRDALLALLEPLGTIHHFIKPGQKVLVKPNMLAGKSPDDAVTTHPEIVRQVILLCQEAGGCVTVGDSPGLGKPETVAKKCGIFEAVESTGADLAAFDESVAIHLESGTFHKLEVAREALETDIIVNLPKLKTHQMMGYTGAVKNLFGLVVGMRKIRLHLQAGTDKGFFALLLLELAERYHPALSIMDAVVGMEGNGPGSGDPVHIGAVMASSSPLALDTVATKMVGLDDQQVWTQKVAKQTQRPGSLFDDIILTGEDLASLKPTGFRPAKTSDINFGLPTPIKNLFKNSISARPEVLKNCRRCGHCVLHCPPEAMHMDPSGVKINYDQCIRCFCCQELCPHNAIGTQQGLILKLAEFINHSSR